MCTEIELVKNIFVGVVLLSIVIGFPIFLYKMAKK